MLVVSPHLDDAVLSAFALLDHQTNTSVLTVFTGAPADLTTDWDRDRGFPDATAQMSARLLEEHAVMDFVGISHEELDFIPVEYRPAASLTLPGIDIVVAVTAKLGSAQTVALPVGAGGRFSLRRKVMHRLFPRRRPPGGTTPHPDHLATTDLLIGPILALGRDLLLYEDLPYLWAGRGDERAALLAARHNSHVELLSLPVDRGRKAAAIALYASQADAIILRPADQIADVLPTHERFWILRRL